MLGVIDMEMVKRKCPGCGKILYPLRSLVPLLEAVLPGFGGRGPSGYGHRPGGAAAECSAGFLQ